VRAVDGLAVEATTAVARKQANLIFGFYMLFGRFA
jgi:hypothetical protein